MPHKPMENPIAWAYEAIAGEIKANLLAYRHIFQPSNEPERATGRPNHAQRPSGPANNQKEGNRPTQQGGRAMPQFLTTSGISHEMERIIREAKQEVIIVSPYLKTNPILQEYLQDKSRQQVPIKLVYGKVKKLEAANSIG